MKLSIADDPEPGDDHFLLSNNFWRRSVFQSSHFERKKEPELMIDGGSSLFASLVKLNKPNTNEYFMDLGDDDNPSKQERSPDQVIPTFVSKSIIERLTNETMKGKKVFEKEAF